MNIIIYLPLCTKTTTTELTSDFSMPDYQPEIRRLLRVRTTVTPPSSYVGAGRAEFAGAVHFHILYSGNDGALYSATTAENYEISAPIDRDSDVDFSDDILAFCDIEPEMTVGRVTAPRKLSLRCRLRAQIKAFGRHRFCERIVGEAAGIERLMGESTCAWLTGRAGESFTLSDEITPEVKDGELRVISSDATVNVSETVPTEDGVGCRGEVTLRLLTCRDGSDELPTVSLRRIPFSITVPTDDFNAETACRATGCCTDITAEVTADGRVLCELAAAVTVEGQQNVPVVYTADLFSTERQNDATYTEYRFPRAERCVSGNFTQSIYEPLNAFGLDENCEIVDITATAAVENITCERGRRVIAGNTRIHLLTHMEEEYAGHEITLPFRYETDGEEGELMLSSVEVTMTSGRARVEGGRLGVECEMAVSGRFCIEERLTALTEARFGEAVEKSTDMIIAFPGRDESRWGLAKRYHVAVDVIERLNASSTGFVVVNE